MLHGLLPVYADEGADEYGDIVPTEHSNGIVDVIFLAAKLHPQDSLELPQIVIGQLFKIINLLQNRQVAVSSQEVQYLLLV